MKGRHCVGSRRGDMRQDYYQRKSNWERVTGEGEGDFKDRVPWTEEAPFLKSCRKKGS